VVYAGCFLPGRANVKQPAALLGMPFRHSNRSRPENFLDRLANFYPCFLDSLHIVPKGTANVDLE